MSWEKIYLKELHKQYLFWHGIYYGVSKHRNVHSDLYTDGQSVLWEHAKQYTNFFYPIICKFIKQSWPEKYETMSIADILKQDGFKGAKYEKPTIRRNCCYY